MDAALAFDYWNMLSSACRYASLIVCCLSESTASDPSIRAFLMRAYKCAALQSRRLMGYRNT